MANKVSLQTAILQAACRWISLEKGVVITEQSLLTNLDHKALLVEKLTMYKDCGGDQAIAIAKLIELHKV